MCQHSEHACMTIAELEPADFPIIRDWIDPNLFRTFHAPVGDRFISWYCMSLLQSEWADRAGDSVAQRSSAAVPRPSPAA